MKSGESALKAAAKTAKNICLVAILTQSNVPLCTG